MTPRARILAAAESRIRSGGYNGFSFRDIARDTGLTNAGVHHHFPTKADLAVEVARDYAARFIADLNATPMKDRVARLHQLFADSLRDDGKMCLCGLLAAESGALPDEVVEAVAVFFDGLADLLTEGLSSSNDPEGEALGVLARLEGAILIAQAMSDPSLFERATAGLGERD